MKYLLNASAVISALLITNASASETSNELTTLLKEKKAQLETHLKQNPDVAKRLCPLIMSQDFYGWAENAGLGPIARNKIMAVCQSISLEQVETKKVVQKPKEEEKKIELPKVEGFVKNYDQYAALFNTGTQPKAEDIKALKDTYFNFEIAPNVGLQAIAQKFVSDGKLAQLLKNNPALVGSIAQMQAYFGNGNWNKVDRTKAQSFDPSPILKIDYNNPYGAGKFDVTIYSLFHTILEQADKNQPRDEHSYQQLLDEIQKGIRVRHLMQQ